MTSHAAASSGASHAGPCMVTTAGRGGAGGAEEDGEERGGEGGVRGWRRWITAGEAVHGVGGGAAGERVTPPCVFAGLRCCAVGCRSHRSSRPAVMYPPDGATKADNPIARRQAGRQGARTGPNRGKRAASSGSRGKQHRPGPGASCLERRRRRRGRAPPAPHPRRTTRLPANRSRVAPSGNPPRAPPPLQPALLLFGQRALRVADH